MEIHQRLRELELQQTRYQILSFVVLRTLKRVAGLVLDHYELQDWYLTVMNSKSSFYTCRCVRYVVVNFLPCELQRDSLDYQQIKELDLKSNFQKSSTKRCV